MKHGFVIKTTEGPQVVTFEQDEDKAVGSPLGSFSVRAHNNDITPFNSVMGVFIISCGYTEQVARKYTMQIHLDGASVCYWGSKERCESVIEDFKKIGVKAELLEEKS